MLRKINTTTIRSSFLTTILFLSLIFSVSNLYIETIPVAKADSTNSGFNFFDDAYFIVFVEDGSYKDIDVSGYIPEGSSGVILDIVNSALITKSCWVRKKGSTDDHYLDINTKVHKYAYVGVDENRVFQARAEDSNIEIWLIGYSDSDSVVYFDDGVDYSLGVTGSYQDIDASADLPEGATGVIMFAITDAEYWDIRHPDSTDAITGHLSNVNLFPQFGLCGVNSSRMFQGQISDLAVDFYIIGYTKGLAITWLTNYADVSLGIYDSWEDIDVTGETSVDATGVMLRYKSTSGSNLEATSRINGSTDDRHAESRIGILSWTFGACGLDEDEIFEGYADSSAIDHYVIGYCEEIAGGSGNIVYPDHVEYSIGVTNASHTLDNNGTYATMDFDAVIIWDFGEIVENVTAIRWELVHGVSGGMWKLTASENYVDWLNITQHIASETLPSPPTTKNDSTRYDSETSGRFRYLKMFAVRSVLSDWWLDYICVIVQPPAITYDDGTYQYPTYLVYYNWEVRGTWGGDTNYASRPFNMLGENMTTTGSNGGNSSQVNWLVTEDDDPDNYVVLKFDDYYNITSAEVKTNVTPSNQHAYFYVSQYPDSDWVLIWDHTGNLLLDWYGDDNITLSYIRYAKIRCTGTPNNHLKIDTVRLLGVLSAGSPPENGNGNGGFILPTFIDLPEWLGDVLGIGVFGAGIFLSAIILMMFLLPIVWYGKNSLAVMIVGVTLVGFLVTITWLPVWIILIIILLIAGMYASKIADWMGSSTGGD